MAVKYTPDQQRVIDTRDKNILVSAAAGSGKTAVLVERIIRKICDEEHPVDIDRLLIVTFTSAAAAQMRERISRAIQKRLEEHPENEHLQKQSALIHNAQITTIDSFCLFIIRNNFNEIGLDPGFRVADEGEIKLLEADVMEKLLEDAHGEASPEFLHFVDSYSTGSSDQKIEEAIYRLYHFSMSYPFPEEWLEARREDYKVQSVEELNDRKWYQDALKYMDTVLEECRKRIHKALEIAQGYGGPIQYVENLEADLQLLENMGKARDYSQLYDSFTYISFTTLSRKKAEDVDPVRKDMVKAIRDEVKKSIADLKKTLFPISPEDMLADMSVCQKAVDELVTLTLSFKERLDAAKRDKNLVDFSDMEHFALEILLTKDDNGELKPRETALELQDYFEEIMIDEYQDSNEVQELLLRSISGEDKGHYNRFMVGDVKQSIYKFRLARPEIFMEKYDTYKTGEDVKDRVRIDLSRNFRSRREVTEATNFLCGQLMAKEVGNVEYDENAALYAGASYVEPQDAGQYATELLIATDSEDESQPMTEKEKEAVMVAERIQELVGHFPVTDDQTGEQRPAKYSDIVLLFRATTGWDEDFRRILTQKGIPVHITSKTGYFQTLEIQGIVNLLRVLDNPLQDIPLYGVLKLPCFDITEAEVAMLRCAAKEKKEKMKKTADKQFLYEEICQYCKEPPAQDGTVYDEILLQKLAFLLQKLEQYRRMVAYTPIKELLGFLIQDTGYDTYVSSMPGGDQRQANIALLLERAGNFEKTSFYGLFHFIRYLETMQEQEVDFGEANILDESADVVRVMTIHKSKGLEFPICFVCGMAKQFNQMDARASILMDVELGIGVDCIDPVMRTRRKTMRKNVVAQRMKEDTRGEDLRVLYVALTRAKEKLILTAYQGEKLDKKLSDRLYLTMENAQKLPFSVVMGSACYFDMILSALMRHRDMESLLEERGLPYEKHQLPYGEIPLQIRLWQEDNSLEKKVKETGKAAMLEEALSHTAQYADTQLEQKLSDRLNFKYPYAYLEGLTVKTTVSELKKAAFEEEAEPAAELIMTAREPYIPRFISGEEAVQGTQYGTAVHKVMELLSFDASYQNVPSDKVYMGKIWGEMQTWIAEGRVQKEDIACVNTSRIASFFHSNLAKRMISAQQRGELYREQPFVLGLPAHELKEQYPSEETVLIQGVIDVFFYEDGELVIADYKTDRVEQAIEPEKRYRTQLDYYQRALEQITGAHVKERIIYSFALAQEIGL